MLAGATYEQLVIQHYDNQHCSYSDAKYWMMLSSNAISQVQASMLLLLKVMLVLIAHEWQDTLQLPRY
jgi:hypothetical protein